MKMIVVVLVIQISPSIRSFVNKTTEARNLSTVNTTYNHDLFLHMLLHGATETDQTMFAKGSARHSGLEYAIMTGGDIAPLGKDAMTEIHKQYCLSGPRPTGRESSSLSTKQTHSLGDIGAQRRLERTRGMRAEYFLVLHSIGETSSHVMVVPVSNQPDQFDGTITDRVDYMVYSSPSLFLSCKRDTR